MPETTPNAADKVKAMNVPIHRAINDSRGRERKLETVWRIGIDRRRKGGI